MSTAVRGLTAEKPLVVRIFLRPPEGEVTTLLLSLLKELGGMILMLAVLYGFYGSLRVIPYATWPLWTG